MTFSGLCICHLVVWSYFNFLHNSQWISFPIQSCLVFLLTRVCYIRLFFINGFISIVITRILFYSFEFFTSTLTDGFWLEFEWHQVSRTLLIILANLNYAVLWMLPTWSHIYKSSNHFISPLEIVPSTQITVAVTVNFMFHIFSLARSWYLYLFSLSFNFSLRSVGMVKSTIQQVLFFWLSLIRSGRLVEIRWSVCISNSQRILSILFTWMDSGFCICHLFVWPVIIIFYSFRVFPISVSWCFFSGVWVTASLPKPPGLVSGF